MKGIEILEKLFVSAIGILFILFAITLASAAFRDVIDGRAFRDSCMADGHREYECDLLVRGKITIWELRK